MEKCFQINSGGWNVACRLSEPEQVNRVVLGVHGFSGSAQDQIQTGIAEEMVLFRSAVLRFDFPGHGQSPVEELSLKGCVESLLAVARFARERYPLVEDLCIFATGMGAYVTLIALDELIAMPGRVKLVVQTPSVQMSDTVCAMLNVTPEQLKAAGKVTIPVARALDVTYDFYRELEEHSALTVSQIPFLILHGEDDDYIPTEDIEHLRHINDRAKLVIIPGTSHQFQEEGAWDMVLDLTRDWFEFEQVLLADWE